MKHTWQINLAAGTAKLEVFREDAGTFIVDMPIQQWRLLANEELLTTLETAVKDIAGMQARAPNFCFNFAEIYGSCPNVTIAHDEIIIKQGDPNEHSCDVCGLGPAMQKMLGIDAHQQRADREGISREKAKYLNFVDNSGGGRKKL